MKKTGLLILLFSVITINSFSQLNINGQIRPRAEFRNGFKTLKGENWDPAFFIEQRSRVSINYSKPDWATFKFSLQDIRIWGEVPQINKTDGLSSVHEAWASVPIGAFRAKAGRQEIIYDDARIFGNLNWAAQGRSHDALKLIYEDSASQFHAHVIGAFNQDANPPEPARLNGTYHNPQFSGFAIQPYKTFQAIHIGKKWSGAKLTGVFINNGYQQDSSTVNFTQTFGFNGSVTLSPSWKLSGTYYYQTGTSAAGQDMDAMLLSAQLQNKTSDNLTNTLGLDYLSGNGPSDSLTNKAFDPLYGTHHKFYGFMDYFYVGNPHGQRTGTGGIIDLYLKTSWSPVQGSSFAMHLHEFWSPVEVLNYESANNPEIDTRLGTEVDLVYSHKINDIASIKLGYSQMWGTSSLKAFKSVGNADPSSLNNWAWVMLNVNPTLLSTK